MPEVLLTGGLGNQLFGLALAWELTSRRSRRAVSLNGSRLRTDAWPLFGIPGLRGASERRGIVATAARKPVGRLRHVADPTWRRERSFAFDASILGASWTRVYEGYFQSEKYFPTAASELHTVLRAGLASLMQSPPILRLRLPREFHAIHVRRGDYLASRDFHGVCGQEYFGAARAALNDPTPEVVVTNAEPDDPVLDMFGDARIITARDLDSAPLILAILASGASLVMSNSSLSWWAAWVGQYGKQAVAPYPWFQSELLDTKDLYVATWRRVHSSFISGSAP